MARDADIESRLQRWAQAVSVGDGSGYPTMNILCREWMPPAPGQSPSIKVASHSDAGQTHRLLARLSLRLRNTVVVHYCLRVPLAEQALRLDCAERTVLARVEEAHRQLKAFIAHRDRDADDAGTFCELREPG